MRLRWTTPAANDLYKIVQRIQQDNPVAASDVAQTLYDGCGSLRDFPYRGRKGRIEATRELVFPGLPYIVVYEFKIKSWKSFAFTMERKTGREVPSRSHRFQGRCLQAINRSFHGLNLRQELECLPIPDSDLQCNLRRSTGTIFAG